MIRARFSLPAVLAVAAAAVLTVLALLMLHVAQSTLTAGSIDAATSATITRRLLGVFVTLAVFAAAAAAVGGGIFGRSLARVRAAVLARARGETDAPLPDSIIRELHDLTAAVERLSARDAARELQLRRDHAEIAVMLDTISEGILRIDAAGRVLRANAPAWSLLGLRRDVIGQPFETQVRHAELRRIVERAAAGERVDAAEITLDDRRLIVSARPVEDETDERGGGVVAFVDLTEVRRLEGVRRDFVANVSHELKTPLTSIRGYVETLLTDDALPDDLRRQFLEVVHKNADRLHSIVDDLLDLSRLESGGWRPDMMDIDATSIIDDVCTACSPRADAQRVSIRTPDAPVGVVADPGGLRQVLSNLVDNALRYTPGGGSIEISARPANGPNGARPDAARYVVFEVRDTGTGIPSDALPRIFERFYRVDPARSRAEGGTGLGLSIVRHLVESMGGDVSAESELGRGTVIRFRLKAGTAK